MRLRAKFLFIAVFTILSGLLTPHTAFADTFTLTGHVQDSSGIAVSGAEISVNDANSDSTTTNASGNYTLIVPNGTYNIQVTPPSGSTFSSAIALNQTVSADTVLNFILTSIGSTTVSGHIYDASGTPVPDQTVGLLKFSDGSEIDVTTDSTGAYSIDQVTTGATYRFIVKGGSSTLKVPQSYSIAFNFTPTQTTILDVTIPAKEVTMHVKDSANNPVNNVAIKAGPSGGPGNPVSLSLPIGGFNATAETSYNGLNSVTDTSGNATLWLLPNDTGYPTHLYTFTAVPAENSGFNTTIVSNVAVTNATQQTITLQEPISINGHIYDALGIPVPDQTVGLLKFSDGSEVDVTTDTSGAYSIDGVTPGTNYRFIVKGGSTTLAIPQKYSIAFNYAPTQSSTLDITIPAKKVILQVKDSANTPLSDVSVSTGPSGGPGNPVNLSLPINAYNATAETSYNGFNSITDASGNVTFWLLPNDTGYPTHLYTFTATPPSESNYFSTSLSNISVTGNSNLSMTLQQPVTISGHIYDASGNPVPDQTVGLLKYSTGFETDVTSDSTGAYSIDGISTGSNYRFIVKGGNGNNPSIHVPQNYLMFGDYNPTQSTTLNVTVPAKKVSLHVQDSLNNAVSNVNINANPASGTTGPVNFSLPISVGITGTGVSSYSGTAPVTDASGNATLWLLPNNDSNIFSNHLYVLTATPSNSNTYSSVALNNISVISDQSNLISLQYSHATPVTTATVVTQHTDGTYSDPATVTLAAIAASGYSVAGTYYTVDGGAQQTYSAPFDVLGDGSHTVTYWSVDNSGVQEVHGSKTFTIHVDQAPHVNPISGVSITQGGTYTASGSFTDTDSSSWTATVDYGDGAGPVNLSLSGQNFLLSHQYTTAGTYTVTVVVRDNQQSTGSTMATVNVAPSSTTVNFNDRTANTALNGSYAGIDWGTGIWDVDGPIATDTTNSISFHSSSALTGTFSFSTPQVLVSTNVYSNSSTAALVTLSCSGNPNVSVQVAPNTSTTLTTNWTNACSVVTVTSSNGWNTNLDNIVYAATATPSGTPTPTPGNTFGNATQGALIDSGDSGTMNGSKFTTGATAVSAQSMSVFVNNIDNATHSQYQMAIYTNNNGVPGTRVANTATGNLTAFTWNTLPITATLTANTTYWLMYNTNGRTTAVNNMYYDSSAAGSAAWAKRAFGTWPTTFPAATSDSTKFSLYVTYQ